MLKALLLMSATMLSVASSSSCSYNGHTVQKGEWLSRSDLPNACFCSGNNVWTKCTCVHDGKRYHDKAWRRSGNKRCQCSNQKWLACEDLRRCQQHNGGWVKHGGWGTTKWDRCECDDGKWKNCAPREACTWNNKNFKHGEWRVGAHDRCQCQDGAWTGGSGCESMKAKCVFDGTWFDHGAWRRTGTGRCQCDTGLWKNCEEFEKDKCEDEGAFFNDGVWRKIEKKQERCQCNGGVWSKCEKVDAYPKKISFSFPTRQQFRDQFKPEDFTFDLLGREPNAMNAGGKIQAANVVDVPALFGEGLSFSLFTIEPCGINLPHVHPRATEILYVIDGPKHQRFLQTAFVEPNGGRTVVNKLKKGEMTFFPEGLLHYQQNLGCERVQYISALNHEDPGVSTMTFAFASLPDNALQSSLGLGADDVSRLVKGLPANPAQGQLECRKKCGIW